MKHIAIVYRPHRPKAFQAAKELATWLKQRNVTVYSHADQKKIPGTIPAKHVNKLNFIIALGGDGTYLRAIRAFNHQTPIIGINMGYLGFLTEVPVHNMYQVIEAALKNKLKFKPRTMLEITIKKSNGRNETTHALNDIVIERGPVSRLINMSIFSNDSLVTELKADGLIVSTPTGSTAYNLAAGGPITHPEVKGIVITPICPHSFTIRPITLPDDQTITIKLSPSPSKAVFRVDGQRGQGLTKKDIVIIKKSKHPHLKLSLSSHDYFEVLRKKLNFGQRD